MTTDPKAGERMALGARCRELAQSPAFIEAVEAIDGDYRSAMFKTAVEAKDTREMLYLEYNGFRRIIARLKSWERDGILAQAELDGEKVKEDN